MSTVSFRPIFRSRVQLKRYLPSLARRRRRFVRNSSPHTVSPRREQPHPRSFESQTPTGATISTPPHTPSVVARQRPTPDVVCSRLHSAALLVSLPSFQMSPWSKCPFCRYTSFSTVPIFPRIVNLSPRRRVLRTRLSRTRKRRVWTTRAHTDTR